VEIAPDFEEEFSGHTEEKGVVEDCKLYSYFRDIWGLLLENMTAWLAFNQAVAAQ